MCILPIPVGRKTEKKNDHTHANYVFRRTLALQVEVLMSVDKVMLSCFQIVSIWGTYFSITVSSKEISKNNITVAVNCCGRILNSNGLR